MIGQYLKMIHAWPYEATRAERRIKCEGLREILRTVDPASVYAETSHMFIKTFFDVVLEEFTNVEVIVLRRDLAHVLKSFIEMGYFSDRNRHWRGWMSSPEAATAALPPIRPEATLDQFDRSIAYLLDIEARAERFKLQYPGVPLHEVTLESLNTVDEINNLFAALRITPTAQTREILGRTINERPFVKERVNNPTTLEICRARLQQYRNLLDRAR